MRGMDEQSIGFARQFEHSQQLFNAALEEFIEKGYENASINSILQTAGMSKGQFYYHFQNKEGLYLALIGVLIEQKKAFLASVMKPEDFQQDIFGILKTQIGYGLQFAQAFPAINRFSESFIKEQGNPIYKKSLETYNFEDNNVIDNLVEQAHKRGELRDDLPLPFIRGLIGYLLTHSIEVAELDTAEHFEEKLEHLISFMKLGLGKQS